MTIYSSTLLHRELVAERTLACTIERPNGVTFRPGEYVDVTLPEFYSSRRPEDAAYLDELNSLATQIAGFRLVPTMTCLAASARPWTGETQRLSATLLARHLAALRGPQYYLSGSTLFISGLCQELDRASVPAADIRLEMYAGY